METGSEIYGINEYSNVAENRISNWATPSWDLFIFVFFAATVLIFVLSLSRERLFLVLISTYITAAIIYLSSFFQEFFLKSSTFGFWKIFFFLIFLFLVIGLTSRIHLITGAKFFEKIWQIVWFSILETGLLFSLFFLILPAETLGRLSPLTQALFDGAVARSAWAILPILSLIFVKKR